MRNVQIPGVQNNTWPSDHPNIGVQAGQWYTHAAGKYQIMPATWKRFGFSGMPFTPQNQDFYGLKQLNALGVPAALDAGNLGSAIHLAGGTWCSLPNAWGACRKQPHRSLADFTAKYNQFSSGC